MTRAQEHIVEKMNEQIELAETQLVESYANMRKFMGSKYSHELIPNFNHQIGYWEAVKAHAEFILKLIDMDEVEFERYHREQLLIELHNREMMDEIKKNLNNKLKDAEEE